MPRRIEQPEVSVLNVAVMKRGGCWCIIDDSNRTIAGITPKAYAAIVSGKALTAQQILDH